mmetsp:Transcript_27907/g.68078  ORF Transcript_27907/g.68078 Transcript_27907/m.68078 type:complete len:200 (-) Transcript_27907:146-745(-)
MQGDRDGPPAADTQRPDRPAAEDQPCQGGGEGFEHLCGHAAAEGAQRHGRYQGKGHAIPRRDLLQPDCCRDKRLEDLRGDAQPGAGALRPAAHGDIPPSRDAGAGARRAGDYAQHPRVCDTLHVHHAHTGVRGAPQQQQVRQHHRHSAGGEFHPNARDRDHEYDGQLHIPVPRKAIRRLEPISLRRSHPIPASQGHQDV